MKSQILRVRESGELSVEDDSRDCGFDTVINRGKKLLQDVENLVQEVIKQQHGKNKGSQVKQDQVAPTSQESQEAEEWSASAEIVSLQLDHCWNAGVDI